MIGEELGFFDSNFEFFKLWEKKSKQKIKKEIIKCEGIIWKYDRKKQKVTKVYLI